MNRCPNCGGMYDVPVHRCTPKRHRGDARFQPLSGERMVDGEVVDELTYQIAKSEKMKLAKRLKRNAYQREYMRKRRASK